MRDNCLPLVILFILLYSIFNSLKSSTAIREPFRVDGGAISENSLRGVEEVVTSSLQPVAINNPQYPKTEVPSYIAKEQEILTDALMELVFDDTKFGDEVTLADLGVDKNAIHKRDNLLTQGSVPTSIQFPQDELDYIVHKFMSQLNNKLELANRRYGLLQVQGRRKEELEASEDIGALFRYTLDLFIVEQSSRDNNYFSQNIKVVFDLQTPSNDSTTIKVRQAQVVAGDPLDIFPEYLKNVQEAA